MRRRRLIASARISTARTCSKAGWPAGRGRHRLAQPRARPRSRRAGGRPRGGRAFAVGPITPLVVRGPAPVMSWMPPRLPPVSDDTTMRLLDLYRHTDPALARVLEDRLGLAAMARAGGMETQPATNGPVMQVGGIAQVRAYFAEVAGAAAKFLASAEARASARWRSTAGTRTSTRARSAAGSPICSARSTARSPRSRPTWARPGAKPSWR